MKRKTRGISVLNLITLIKHEFLFQIFSLAKNDTSFIYPDLRDKERTCIMEKVKSRDKYTCSKIPCNPVQRTAIEAVSEYLDSEYW